MATIANMQKPPNQPGVAEVKPRLTKEQHDILEAEFQRHHKPSTATKKGFADHLGVPLDKINNWFQNRRAKVKQEAKKAQNAQLMQSSIPFHHMQHHPVQHVSHVPQQQPQQQHQHHQHQHQQPPQAPPQQAVSGIFSMGNGFSAGPAPAASQAPLAGDHLDIRQSIEDPLQAFTSQPEYSALFLGSISESTQPASKESVIESMIKAGYGWDQVGAQDLHAHSFPGDPNFGLSLDITGATSHLGDSLTNGSLHGFDYAEEGGPSGVSPSNSASSGPSTFSVATSAATAATSNPMGSSTNLSFSWTDNAGSTDATPAKQIDNPFEADLHNYANGTHPASSSQVSLPQWMNAGSFPHGTYQHSNNSSQVLLATPEQVDQAQLQNYADLEPPMPPFAEGAYSRRSSSTSVLVENLKTVGIHGADPNTGSTTSLSNGGFQAPVAPSGLAARRQRHPAPLNQNMRSASFTNGMSGMPSPGSVAQNLAADHSLRRIRSTGLTNGRIQKPASSSAPRSPLQFSFEQATNSPKFARQVAGYSTAVSTPGLPVSTSSLAPPTPCTPSDGGGGRFAWQPSAVPKPQPPTTDSNSPPDSLGIQWPSEASSEDAFPVNSPPRTPLEASQLSQMRLNQTVYRDTPPQSAPATQACFARPMYAPGAMPTHEFLAPNEFSTSAARNPSHIRRPSLPVSNFGVDGSMSYGVQMPTAAGVLQVPYSMQFGTNMMNGFNTDAMSLFPDDGTSMPTTHVPGQPTTNASDFFVHQYSPPQAADQKGTASPRRPPEPQIKNYVFANAGPHDFQAS